MGTVTENKVLLFVIMAITLCYTQAVKTRNNKIRCILVVTVILTCFSGFRSWRMGDMRHYCWAYLETNLPNWELTLTESGDTIGLQLFYRFMGQLGLSFEVCVFVAAAFVAITLGILVFRYSTSPFWSYVMYLSMGFYLGSMNTLKQAIAMGFIVLAMMAILEHKPIRFILLVAAGTMFHTPAMVFVIAYPFAHKKIDVYYFLLVVLLTGAVFFFRDQIIDTLTDVYYEDTVEMKAAEFLGGKALMMAVILVATAILRPLRRFDTVYCQVFNVMVLATIAQTFSVYDNVFTRLADYFFQFIVLLIPMMLQSYKLQVRFHPAYANRIRYWHPRMLFAIQMVLISFAVWFYMSTINGSAGLLNAFRFFWQAEGESSLELLAEMLVE